MDTGRTSVLKHAPRKRICVLREDLLALCGGNIPAAIILSIMEYRTNGKVAEAEQKTIENEARIKEGLPPLEKNLWIYKSYQHFIDDSLGLLKDYQVRQGITFLLEHGYIEKRTNPNYQWDRTLQYRLCQEAVNVALDSMTDASVTHNGSKDNGQRINDEYVTDQSPAGNEAIPKKSFREDIDRSLLEKGATENFSLSQEKEEEEKQIKCRSETSLERERKEVKPPPPAKEEGEKAGPATQRARDLIAQLSRGMDVRPATVGVPPLAWARKKVGKFSEAYDDNYVVVGTEERRALLKEQARRLLEQEKQEGGR